MPTQDSLLKNSTFAFIDLETTGGNATWDRITEVAICLWRNGEVVEEWQSLVNPQMPIPVFIQRLTGITDAMVADAPVFSEILPAVRERLEGHVFVAHNARFDHAFIKADFRRLGLNLSVPVLCTVKLSRRLYPHHKRHNMDALIERHGLDAGVRHRAMGDVVSMLGFFHHALEEKGYDALNAAIAKLLKQPSLPPHVPPDTLQQLPERPGVYRFIGENEAVLYVGKSTNIRQRVASHFYDDHRSARELKMSQSLCRVEWTPTAGELGALLLELKQIKSLNPLYNRRSRASRQLVSLRLVPNARGYLEVRIERAIDPAHLGDYFGLFRSRHQAMQALSGIARANRLCNRLLGLEPAGQGACFLRQLGQCQGACEAAEDVTRYNLRMGIALHSLQLKTWPWKGAIAVVEEDEAHDRRDYLVTYNWIHLTTVHELSDLNDVTLGGTPVTFDLDAYRLIVKALLGPTVRRPPIVELPHLAQPRVVMPGQDQ